MNDPKDSLVDQAQPLIAHLIELRTRVLKGIVCIIAVFLCLYPFSNDLYVLISEPLRVFLPQGSTMIATDVASPFFTPFKLTLMTSVFIGMPYLLYQLWSFIAPLEKIGPHKKKREKREKNLQFHYKIIHLV